MEYFYNFPRRPSPDNPQGYMVVQDNLDRLNHALATGKVPNADLLDGLDSTAFELISRKGVASGYAGLDAGAHVPLAQLAGLLTLTKVVMLAGTGNYVPTVGTKMLYVECIGGGAGGGGCLTAVTNSAAAGGGGGGAYSAVWTQTIKTYAYVVGAGGNGGAAGNNPGAVGVDTTFDSPSICTAKGGAGGGGDAVAAPPRAGGGGGVGGSSATGVGDLKSWGISGLIGFTLAASQAVSGSGGAGGGFGGTGGAALKVTSAGNGGGAYGGGGGGALILAGLGSVAGGNGAAGTIRVWEFQGV